MMTTLFAYGNIQQSYPFQLIPAELLTKQLSNPPETDNPRVLKRHRCRWVAHFLLWQLLQKAGENTALLQHIYYSSSGRPCAPESHIDFNISHSGDWAAVLLHIKDPNSMQESAVGIDIESPQHQRDYTALLQYFAPTEEQNWFTQQPQAESAFYQTWCLREAILKSQGFGIVKLSEVQHFPEQAQIHSKYCPTGQLLFSNQLPFYLALFVNQHSPLNPQYFSWNGETLVSTSIPITHCYQVNY